jgi:hypothetical protein
VNSDAPERTQDGDISGNAVTAAASAAPTGKTSLDSFQEVITGAKINF